MNYDIKIRSDGCPIIEGGDFVPATYAQYIEQKIYNALMNMEANIITSIPAAKHAQLEANIIDYLSDYFAGDLDVDPYAIQVGVTPLPGAEKLQFSLSYEGVSPTGEDIEYEATLNYSFSAGAILSAEFNPSWLSIPQTIGLKDVVFPITVRSISNKVEIPMEPYYDVTNNESLTIIPYPMYLLLHSQLEDIDTLIQDTFSIPLYATRSKYQVSSYLQNYVRREHVIDSYEIESSTALPEETIIYEYGEPVIVVDKGTTGLITGTAILRKAVQATTQYSIEQEKVVSPLFPLRRRRGKYFAIFPKTLQIGDYFLKYKAMSEVR